jgi:8-oxo-dGTP diphosphatase
MRSTQGETGMKNKKKMGASITFLNTANQILLFLRDDKPGLPFPNCWDVLGGGVAASETPLECITRKPF